MRRVMKLFLDSSNTEVVYDAVATGLIDGVTTNPSLMMKAGKDPRDVILEICNMFGWTASVSAEVVGSTAEEMLDMADDYIDIHPSVTIKLPLTPEGLKACKELSEDGISTNVTLCFSVSQAILAAKAGATYVSPFVGRLNDNSVSGVELIRAISDVYSRHSVKTQILAASIRDVHQVGRCFGVGADICTIPPAVFNKMYKHVLTDKGLEQFDKDWQTLQENLKP
tara:strand:- start:3060 stop:3734 length:675 start_codon:yes stop_codon:yes gene_type:complete